jgi:hypothetical protein
MAIARGGPGGHEHRAGSRRLSEPAGGCARDDALVVVRAGGFGGFEIQPVYPLSPDDPAAGLRNLTYLSDEFIDALRFAAREGREQGLRVDVTLGSGWPFGGPHVPVTQAAAQIRMEKRLLAPNQDSVLTPPIGPGEKLLAAFGRCRCPPERALPSNARRSSVPCCSSCRVAPGNR